MEVQLYILCTYQLYAHLVFLLAILRVENKTNKKKRKMLWRIWVLYMKQYLLQLWKPRPWSRFMAKYLFDVCGCRKFLFCRKIKLTQMSGYIGQQLCAKYFNQRCKQTFLDTHLWVAPILNLPLFLCGFFFIPRAHQVCITIVIN